MAGSGACGSGDEMKAKQYKEASDAGRAKQELRWDFVGLLLALVIASILIFLLDTGSLTEWIAKQKETKTDEVIAATFILLVALSFFFMRRWLALSSRLIKYEESKQHEHLSEIDQLKKAQRRDLIGLFLALGIAVVLVLLFDTGSLAEWIAKQKETKVDEVIVVSAILLVGLCFFSVRRWLELSGQVEKYEELYRKTTKLSRESALLGELSELLQSCLSSAEAHHLITDRAQILFPGSSGALCVTASSRDLVEAVATWGEPALAERFFAPMDCWALRRGRVHILADDPTVLSCAHLGQIRPYRAMCMPMMAHGEALGLLYLDSGRIENKQIEQAPTQLSESEQRLARTFAEQTSLALANLNMREILRMQSVRDPLTGLYNRRYMEESLERELHRASRKNSTVGLMMLDVDHFKRFNDTFGHEAGDSVLRMLGDLFRRQFRGEDVVCRYGGEEFTIILPEASLEGTHQRAAQLCEAAKRDVAQLRGQALEPVTLSIGVSSFPANGTTGDALLRAADAALYRAKQEGRDRVMVA
jgi:diguanylate cyclase (GGDEF)-like protein